MRLLFSESKEFYKKLDSCVEKGKTTIYFDHERPGEKSKLWPRLRKCKNWSLLEKEFEKLKSGENSPLNNVISAPLAAALTGGEIILFAWIATLIASVFFYAIYKNRRVKLKTNTDGDVELEVEPG